MKVLILTGKLAYPLVKKQAENSNVDTIVHLVDNTQVAAFLTPSKIINDIKNNVDLKDIDLILTPGLMRKQTTEITEELKIPTFKGSTDAADLKTVLNSLEDLKLSESKAADKLIEEKKRQQAFEFINNYENNEQQIKHLLKKPNNILVRNLPVGDDFPMRVLAEIANAPSLSKEELTNKAKYFVASGADMIDIGMLAGEDNSDKIPELIKTLRPIVGDRPLSIDTLSSKEIITAVNEGVDLVLSMDHGNCDKILPTLEKHQIPAVLLPTNYSEGFVPHTSTDRIKSMKKLVKRAKNIPVICDLVLDPVNSTSIVESIYSYNDFHKDIKYPMFFGVGNVVELMDTDSVGVNALLTGISMEVGASILFTPEESSKTIGSIHELAIASRMMFLAKKRQSIPKDLGINLLVFKDKHKSYTIEENHKIPIEKAEESLKFKRDPEGSFKIQVIHGNNINESKITATHFKKTKPTIKITGTYAKEIYDEIIKRKLITRLDHAAYLGSELEKAEIALKLRKNYIQDFELFQKPLQL